MLALGLGLLLLVGRSACNLGLGGFDRFGVFVSFAFVRCSFGFASLMNWISVTRPCVCGLRFWFGLGFGL